MFLSSEYLLLIADQAGHAEIQALRATCKANRALLDRYEHSVTNVNIAAKYPFTPSNHILASDTREREVLPKNTFDIIRELETRERHIDEIINSDYLAFQEEFDLQDEGKAEIVRANLKRALWLCSSIADMEAHSICYNNDVVPRRDPRVKSFIHEDIILRDSPPLDGSHLGLEEIHEPLRRDTRMYQINYLHNLTAQDLAGIVVLSHLTSEASKREWSPSGRARPEAIERGLCMAENTLRHGIFFLHSKVLGNEDADDHAKLLIDSVYTELRRWEAGDPKILPGLTMSTVSALCGKIDCNTHNVLRAACTLLRGDVWNPAQDKQSNTERTKPPGEVDA